MAGHKEKIVSFGVTIQPTPNVFNPPGVNDLMPISSPDNGYDPITADDDTMTGSLWNAPRQFLGARGRAGATFRMRGPGTAVVPAAGAWVPGRLLQALGLTEIRNAAAINAAAAANADLSAIVLSAGQSAVDDFYKGYPIQHAGIGVGVRATSMIRDYDGASKKAVLAETLGAAIAAGNFTIPAGLFYVQSTGLNIPLLSCSVWRHKKRYDLMNCAISSFAINVPVSNDQATENPSWEFTMVGTDVGDADEDAPALPDALLTPIPPAKAGKFTFAGLKLGSATMRIEFGLETGAPPNMNFDEGQEPYEVLSGSRTVTLDLNQQAKSQLDVRGLWKNQTQVPLQAIWGGATGNRWAVGVANALLNPLSPNGRNGFVGMGGDATPGDVDRAIALALMFDG